MTRKEIEGLVVRVGVISPEGIIHISDMLDGIQEYIMTRKPTSKFMELCGDENWDYATSIADNMNKEVLKKTELYQDFVKKVKTSSEYISKIRNVKLKEIGI
jgi:hypothetical protein